MLIEKDVDIGELQARIRRLEQSERRLKRQLVEGGDRLANKEVELGEVRRALHTLEDVCEEQKESVRELEGGVDRYRRWWMNEFYSLKVALSLARDPSDRGILAMKESSQARFMTWSAENNL